MIVEWMERAKNDRKQYCLYKNNCWLVRNLPGFIINLLLGTQYVVSRYLKFKF